MSEQLNKVLSGMTDADKTSALVKLARTMSHELNNIFTVAAGNLALLDEALAGDDPNAETLGEVRAAIDRGIALSARLRDFTAHSMRPRENSAGGDKPRHPS